MSRHYSPEILTGKDATEDALSSVRKPRILHIATHGFFQEIRNRTQENWNTWQNPLLRSGLALANANDTPNDKTQSGKNDGILTALEVLSMDLRGTELVVLSACETGIGDIELGDGVYGLKRAFRQAGAHSVLSSLWLINDLATSEFMRHFYDYYFDGNDSHHALQKTQQDFMHHSNVKYRDPYYWAAFTVVGL